MRNAAERALRGIAMPVSLCTSSPSVWKHWKLISGGDVTRTPFMPGLDPDGAALARGEQLDEIVAADGVGPGARRGGAVGQRGADHVGGVADVAASVPRPQR